MYRTIILADGTQVSVPIFAAGPSGVLGTPRHAPQLYLKDKHGRFVQIRQPFTEADIEALHEKIQRPWPFGYEPPGGRTAPPQKGDARMNAQEQVMAALGHFRRIHNISGDGLIQVSQPGEPQFQLWHASGTLEGDAATAVVALKVAGVGACYATVQDAVAALAQHFMVDALFADVARLVSEIYDLQTAWGEAVPLGPPSDPTTQACYVRDVREVLQAHRAILDAILETDGSEIP
jgi:hypothetical protein